MRRQRLIILMTAAIMAAALGSAPSSASVFGSPKFVMSQSDNRFSGDGSTIYTSEGNRISKRSIAGGKHIDKTGVFLNPGAVVDPATRRLRLLTLSLLNVAYRFSQQGSPNGIGTPVRVAFNTGEGSPIVIEVTGGQQRYGQTVCDVVQCSTPVTEGGVAILTIEQYRRIMTAPALAIKVDGSDRDHIYEPPDIEPAFKVNLKAFYDAYLAASA